MNTENNKRRRETIERIKKAFMELIESYDIDQISISQLCKKAGINRTTFYASFDNLYDIADLIKRELVENSKLIYNEDEEKDPDYSVLFQHIKEHQRIYKVFFKLGLDRHINSFDYDTNIMNRIVNDEYAEYQVEFIKAGITRIIQMWLERDCKETVEELVKIVRNECSSR